jgi:hypothetical protein
VPDISKKSSISSKPSKDAVARRLREAGERAKAEAEARRAEEAAKPSLAPEIGGQAGPEPTRYGDWEKNGIVSDF